MNPTEAANRAFATRWFEELWNERRAETARELWADGAVGHMEGLPPLTLEDFLDFHEQLLGAFSDFQLHLLDVLVEGDRVAVEWKITGTHDGPLLGIPPSGRRIEEFGMTKFHVEDGKMVAGWDRWNFGAMIDRLARPSLEEVIRNHPLTRRQAQVALLMADALSAKRIAVELGIKVNTARRHCQAVLRRLGLHSRGEVAKALGRARVSVRGPHPLVEAEEEA
jgi:DNA-binding CsgD family transcriptional regulator/predicted ester cyclase